MRTIFVSKKFVDQLKTKVSFTRYGLINSLKTTFACLLGLLITTLLQIRQPQWVLISTLIVMSSQYRLGGALQKGYARLFATVVGSCLASGILFLFVGHPLLLHLVLFIFIASFTYLATTSAENSYAYSLGAVTMVIILVTSNPQLSNAFDRIIEILLGVSIGILVSRYVLPIHAEKILYRNMAYTLEILKKIYTLSISEKKTFNLNNRTIDLEEEIILHFSQQAQLLKEACAESSALKKNKFKYIVIIRLERRLLRSIYMLHLTLRLSLSKFHEIIAMPKFKALHQGIAIKIEELSKKICDHNVKLSPIELNKQYLEIAYTLRDTFDKYTFEDKNKIHAFIFCLGQVIKTLNRMELMLDFT